VSTLGAIEGEISQGDGGGVFRIASFVGLCLHRWPWGSPSDGATGSATREDEGGRGVGRGVDEGENKARPMLGGLQAELVILHTVRE
jgi:hypothetical protein